MVSTTTCVTTVYVPDPNRITMTLYYDGEPFVWEADCSKGGWSKSALQDVFLEAEAAFNRAIIAIKAMGDLEDCGVRRGRHNGFDIFADDDDDGYTEDRW